MKEITTEEGHRTSSVHLGVGGGSPLTTLMFQLSQRPFSGFSQRNLAGPLVGEEEGAEQGLQRNQRVKKSIFLDVSMDAKE